MPEDVSARVAVYFFARATFVLAVGFPLWYVLYYMSALDARCAVTPQVFFENFEKRRMFVLFMCSQMFLTRVPFLLCAARLTQISSGTPLETWAAPSRFKWAVVTGSVCLITDLAIWIVLLARSDFCDPQPGSSKWNTVGPLCRHSSQVTATGQVFHLLSVGSCLALFVALVVWYVELPRPIPTKQKRP
jgi:hypothetical protein